MEQFEVKHLEGSDIRQSAVGSLNQSIAQLTESAGQAVELARDIQYRLMGTPIGDNAPVIPTTSEVLPVVPLFAGLEKAVRTNLGTIREVNDILAAIRNEIS